MNNNINIFKNNFKKIINFLIYYGFINLFKKKYNFLFLYKFVF